MENEVVVSNNMPAKPVELSPYEMMITAIEKGIDPEKIEKMMEIQERFEANQAMKAYYAAVAEFKKNPPEIKKNSKVRYENRSGDVTSYNHASHYDVISILGKSLAEHGLSLSFKQSQDDKGAVTVTCTMSHFQGYSESTSLTSAPDTSGGKNSIQAISSANTYLQRYTAFAITGTSAEDMTDDDGAGSEIEYINEKQTGQIVDMMAAKNIDHTDFICRHLGLESIEVMPAKMFKRAMNDLKLAKVAS